ncbi:hypothetical protein B5M42_001060 [Paenibacillus athensensis]|uniref:Uncharacterized protein n=1 Tax=Paenibacillus athensensis TaxID=1967502 RepID=A0A4Y8Q6X7_9BACL|nr:hypothetical protein [Paenibacillus athensensis]MCD1257425.1 hypothetical protein [Paenibacillus athensensis]
MKVWKGVPAVIVFGVCIIVGYYLYSLLCVNLIAKFDFKQEVSTTIETAPALDDNGSARSGPGPG